MRVAWDWDSACVPTHTIQISTEEMMVPKYILSLLINDLTILERFRLAVDEAVTIAFRGHAAERSCREILDCLDCLSALLRTQNETAVG